MLKKLADGFNIFSVDVAAGAVCSSAFFASALDSTVPPLTFVVLFLSVWIVYTADHLLDARRITGPAATRRHRAHQLHWNSIAVFFSTILGLLILVIPQLSIGVIVSGVILALIVAVYQAVNRRIEVVKEIFVAAIYTGGVLVPTAFRFPVDYFNVSLILSFGTLVLMNVVVFSWYDRSADKRNVTRSIITVLGAKGTTRLIGIAFGVLIIAAAAFGFRLSFVLILVVGSIQVIIFAVPGVFGSRDRFRRAGEVSFFLLGLEPAIRGILCCF